MVLFQNCVRQLRSPTKMEATVQLRCYWKQLWSRWAITGSWEPLVLHLNLILMLRKHWHHCFLDEFSKDDPDLFKEASSYNQLSPHKVMSRSNLHFLYNYNLVIYNDCEHFNVTLWGRNTNTFYTFRCPQSLEMIRLYLYKKCKLERDMTLCGDNWLYEEASLKKSGSSLLNSARKQWCQCLHNIKFKCKKRIFPFNRYVLNFPGI